MFAQLFAKCTQLLQVRVALPQPSSQCVLPPASTKQNGAEAPLFLECPGSPYMLRRYCPPTLNNASVICPSEQ